VKTVADEVAEVPVGVVTVTPTLPVPGGLRAVSRDVLRTVKLVAGFVPNRTALTLVNPAPVTVTRVPPASGPAEGVRSETVGPYVNTSPCDVAEVPPAVVTVTSTAPVPGGLRTVIVFDVTRVNVVARFVPKFTAVTLLNPVPVIVTSVLPVAGPLAGLTPLTAGAAR
jgi:hypothetical protein